MTFIDTYNQNKKKLNKCKYKYFRFTYQLLTNEKYLHFKFTKKY